MSLTARGNGSYAIYDHFKRDLKKINSLKNIET